jgi:hypothetical protein
MPHALHSRAGVKEEDLQKWNTALMTSYAGMIFVGSGMCDSTSTMELARRQN